MSPNRVSIGGSPSPIEWIDSESDGSTSGTARADRRDRRRTSSGRRALTIVALVVVGVPLILTGVVALMVDTAEVARQVTDRASRVINRPVTVGDASLMVVPRPSVRLEQVEVGNAPAFDGPSLAIAERVDLAVSLTALVSGRIEIARARVAGLRMHVGVDENGTSNFGNLVPAGMLGSDEPRLADEPALTGTVVLSDASLSYFDVPGDRSFLALGIEATVEPSAGDAGHLRLDAGMDSLHLRRGGPEDRIARLEGPSIQAAIGINTERTGLILDGGRIWHESMELDVRGEATGLENDQPRFVLHIENPELQAAGLTQLLGERVRAERIPVLEGRMNVSLRVSGSQTNPPTLFGRVQLQGVGLTVGGERIAEGVTGMVRWTPEGMAVDSIRGLLGAGPFSLDGMVPPEGTPATFRLDASPDLAVLHRLGLTTPLSELSGDAHAQLEIALGREDATTPDVRGTVQLDGVRAEHPELTAPLYVPDASIEVDGDRVAWTDAELLLGEDALATTGVATGDVIAWWRRETRPVLDVRVSGATLDADRSLRRNESSGPFLADVTRHLTGGARRADTPIDRRHRLAVERAPFHGTFALALDSLVHAGKTYGAVSARIAASDSLLSLDQATFTQDGSPVELSGYLAVGTLRERPFSVSFQATGLDAGEALGRLVPGQTGVSGLLDARLEMRGTADEALMPAVDALIGSASLSLTEGVVAGTGVNHAVADFLSDPAWTDLEVREGVLDVGIDGRAVDVTRLTLVGDEGAFEAGGTVTLDGRADLAVGVSVPAERLGDVSLRRTGVAQQVLESLRASGHPLVLGLRMSGTLAGPALNPDASAAEEVVR